MAKMGPDQKKGFSGGFLVFLLAAVLLILGIQTFTADRSARVSFSHQVEHLTNLNLTLPEENRKIAQNENLVAFSGKFRENLPEESAERYRYLELLNQNHELNGESARLETELSSLSKNVRDAADLFLHISGQAIPRSGFVVVGTLFDTADRDGAILIRSLSNKDVVSLPLVQKSLNLAQQTQSMDAIDSTARELRDLVALLRSPALGIGVESIKQELKTLDGQISAAADQSPEQQIRLYRTALAQLVPAPVRK